MQSEDGVLCQSDSCLYSVNNRKWCSVPPPHGFFLSFMLLERSRWLSTPCLRLMRLEMLNVLHSINAVQTLLLLACLNVWRFMGEKMKNITLRLCAVAVFFPIWWPISPQAAGWINKICVALFLWQNKQKPLKTQISEWGFGNEWVMLSMLTMGVLLHHCKHKVKLIS